MSRPYTTIGHDPETEQPYTVTFDLEPADLSVGITAHHYSIESVDGSHDASDWPACASDEVWVESVWLDLVDAMEDEDVALAEDAADAARGAA